MKYKLAVLASHPIQYQAPLFKRLAKCSEIDLTVYFCSNMCTEEETFVPDFGIKFKWDVPLLEGYNYRFLKNLSPWRFAGPFSELSKMQILSELWRMRYDAILIYGYGIFMNHIASLTAKMTGTRILFCGETLLRDDQPQPFKGGKKAFLMMFFRLVDAILVIGRRSREFYRYYQVPSEKMFFSPYSVDNDFFANQGMAWRDKKASLKKEIGVEDDLPVILFVGKFIHRKRPMDLLRAFSKTKKAALVFVGEGKLKKEMMAHVRDNDMQNVFFAGFVNQSDLPRYYSAADIFVLPSDYETWGLVVNEAMNFGLPVIATDKAPCADDLIREGENGYIYPAGDIDNLAGLLNELLKRADLRKRMGKRSLEIISKWSYSEDAEGIKSALQYLKNGPDGSGIS